MAHSAPAATGVYTRKMKAGVLAVGTELTSGQITNRNAAWISKKLSQIGLQTDIHLTVSDDRPSILEALQLLEKKCDFIFVTGGLGPTSDDFTRELIAEWSGLSMEFHEPSWKKIQERLNSRNIPIAEFQKQQCYFPQNSQVLENSLGTANAFYLQKMKKHLWALPGPPNEIEAVWEDHIKNQMTDLTRNLNPYQTVSWDALGIGEAIAPTLVEPVVQGSGADIGYRVHLPYLEIKFSFFKSDSEKMKPYIEKVEKALKPYTVSRNGEDILYAFDKILSQVPKIFIQDEVTQGVLISRLQTVRKHDLTYTTDKNLTVTTDYFQILCHFKDEFEFELELRSPHFTTLKKRISSPFSKGAQMTERRRQYFAEAILIEAVQHWKDL